MTEISFAYGRRTASKNAIRVVFAVMAFALPVGASAQQQTAPVLLNAMTTELHRAFNSLGKQEPGKQLPPFF